MLNSSKILNGIGIIFFIVSITSCKSGKVITDGEVDASISSKRIIQNHYDNQLDFKTLNGRVKIDYSDGQDSQGVSVSLRMKKDEVIWISAPLGVVKAHITPEKVSFYNKLDNEYFDGGFTYLSSILGTDVDFELVQNLLIGNAVLDLRNEKYTASVFEDKYSLKPKNKNDLYKILFFLEPKNFKIAKQQISQPLEDRFLNMDYSYQEVANKVVPNIIKIEAVSNNRANNIALEYKSMEFDRKLNFPYKIPKGFKKIVLVQDAR